ncbi:hypothetical protein AB0J82_26345 [Asanoa sp. NPDC049518]|uniref:hypothetical protein n=1 Tax=unclassified Asanoa TaxID=2685164 RepID=UPI00343ECD8D
MRAPRWAVASTAAVLVLAGCGQPADNGVAPSATPAPTASPTATAPPDPLDVLNAARREISKGNYRFTVKRSGATVVGYRHKPTGTARLKLTLPKSDNYTVEVLVVGKTHLAHFSVKNEPFYGDGEWLKYDRKKAGKNVSISHFFDDVDLPGGGEILAAARDVRLENGDLTGLVDLMQTQFLPALDSKARDLIGDEVSKIPFVADLDDQGRLTKLVLKTGGKLGQVEITYSEYGTVKPDRMPPASDVSTAPTGLYRYV